MSSGEALDLHMTPEAFAIEHAALIGVAHIDKFAYTPQSSPARCLAARGDLIDDFVFACQALARHIYDGTGSPEGAVAAPVGSIYVRSDGGSGTTLYTKESGTGNTGWSALTSAATLSGLVRSGTGSPEGVVVADVGTLYLRTDGSAGTTLYRKESGSGNTGWVAANSHVDLNVSSSLNLTGASSFIQLGLTASAGNAQIRCSKGGSNNQTWSRWQSDDVTQWSAQHDTSENWNLLGGDGAVVLQLQSSATPASRYVRAANGVRLGGTSGPLELTGSGSPEGVVSAPVGSTFARADGSAGTVLYVKETGSGNTGWVAYGVVTQGQISGVGGRVALARNTTLVDIDNTTTETDLVNYTIPAGTLDANGRTVEIEQVFDHLNNGATRSITLRWYVGGVLVHEGTAISFGSNATRHPLWFTTRIISLGATQQSLWVRGDRTGSTTPPATGQGGQLGTAGTNFVLWAADSAADRTAAIAVRITAQHSAATSNQRTRQPFYRVDLT